MYNIILANGYLYENFSSNFFGNYVVEIHSRTNAIGQLIDMKGLNYTSNFNFKPYVEDNKKSFQNNGFLNIFYNNKNWKEINTTKTGNIFMLATRNFEQFLKK